MLPNEVFALERRAYYDSIGLIVDATNGQFAHCPYPKGMGETGYYLLWDDHQHQGLLQSKDIGKLCFFNGHAKKWLTECDPLPENYFELWDIYDQFSGDNGRKAHSEKNEFGKSLLAVEWGRKIHREEDEYGRSVHGVKAAERLNSVKDEFGRSVVGVKGAERLNSLKDEFGRSVRAIEHNKKLHSNRDDQGRSLVALQMNEKIHLEKDEFGRSKVGVEAARRLNSIKWFDPEHPELGNHSAGTLVGMQKARGLPHGKENRKKVG